MHYSTKTRSCAFILYSSQKMLFWSTRHARLVRWSNVERADYENSRRIRVRTFGNRKLIEDTQNGSHCS
ncbi:uncharacterized protein PHALS_05629 [Plasmopara halstedii]|uniref:Uncharacterized protein n=1 Tax=Plasmopara halstedii TaxID=4781 RepID=A0A0P1B424_PLAHL|nr:uncharacterized protein PHALS_05629 [Plasmopara halstedii]CEG48157.1 hypothetical protein PHALS_05629 [Plasmopara halstedii]|eukprot:XP_024584526.1 hypothetical protein PHALS_05629 [Plasmopara halstedii]